MGLNAFSVEMVSNKHTNQIMRRAFQNGSVMRCFIRGMHTFLGKLDDGSWSPNRRFQVFTFVLSAVCHKRNMQVVGEHMELIEFMCRQMFAIGVLQKHAYPFHFVLDACKRMILLRRDVTDGIFVGSDLRRFYRNSMMLCLNV